ASREASVATARRPRSEVVGRRRCELDRVEWSKDGLAHPDRERRARGGGQPDERTAAIVSGITETGSDASSVRYCPPSVCTFPTAFEERSGCLGELWSENPRGGASRCTQQRGATFEVAGVLPRSVETGIAPDEGRTGRSVTPIVAAGATARPRSPSCFR